MLIDERNKRLSHEHVTLVHAHCGAGPNRSQRRALARVAPDSKLVVIRFFLQARHDSSRICASVTVSLTRVQSSELILAYTRQTDQDRVALQATLWSSDQR